MFEYKNDFDPMVIEFYFRKEKIRFTTMWSKKKSASATTRLKNQSTCPIKKKLKRESLNFIYSSFAKAEAKKSWKEKSLKWATFYTHPFA